MAYQVEIRQFYRKHLPHGKQEGHLFKALCPFCASAAIDPPGVLVVHLNPDSPFFGYFRCLKRCLPGGFAPQFGRYKGLPSEHVPGFDPEREPIARDVVFPIRHLDKEIAHFITLMESDQQVFFEERGISQAVLKEMKIGYNGRYLVLPYFQENGHCYAARCVQPEREADTFWHGNEDFFQRRFRIFNLEEIERCEDGALFIADNEIDLLILRALGYPGIAVPVSADLDAITVEQLLYVRHIYLAVSHTPEAQIAARDLATRLGFKVRMLTWPGHLKRGYNLRRLALEKGEAFKSEIRAMIARARFFSPFSPPEKEHRRLVERLDKEIGQTLPGLVTGFNKMDQAMGGIRGLTIMGGPPKAGKSCFFMQVSTEMARRQTPVIYYDFENGRQKIYRRTVLRLAKLQEAEIRQEKRDPAICTGLNRALDQLKEILPYFRVITDRRLNPDIMRRHIDFLKHETRSDKILVVVDSLHKLPFKDLAERRTGIDSWLRHFEDMRDEQEVAFLVISELSRSDEGGYERRPDMGAFKESGDIEYTADNAMILQPDWDLLAPLADRQRIITLWMAASRENSPGKVAEYLLEYPYWGFKEL